jgi:hypothetical protein
MWFETKITDDEQRLLAEYTEATSSYAKAARQLEKRRAASSAVEYQGLLETCEEERGACEDTRLALEALRGPLSRA